MNLEDKYLTEGMFNDADVDIENILEGINDSIKSCNYARKNGNYRELKGFLTVIESDIKDIKLLLRKGGLK